MPMKSDVDVEREIQETSQEAAAVDGPFVPTIMRTEIDDPSEFGDFEYYAWENYRFENKSVSTIMDFFNAVSKLEEFIEQSDRVNCSADNIGNRGAKRFLRWLVDEVEKSTAKTYINKLDNMAQFYRNDGYYSGNPFGGLTDRIDTDDSRNRSSSFQGNERITVDDDKLREAIRSTHGSSMIVVLAILVKTGIRVSEACNLDWEDINLDHRLADDLLPNPRFELSDMPDHMFIDSGKTEDTYEVRTGGNKRKVSTYIPIDSELKRLLLWHALVRERRFDEGNPVLISNNCPRYKSSDRLRINTVGERVADVAKGYGWHDPDRDEKQNVTPHWFRAKFTSYMSKRLEAAEGLDANPKDIVKGLRGDVGEDVIETYRFRDDNFASVIRSQQFKIGLEGL